jgi:GNAT superfamily N-acetyltransferase
MMSLTIDPAVLADLDDVLRLIDLQFDEHAIAAGGKRLRAAVTAVLSAADLGFFLLARERGRAVGVAYVSFVWALEHSGRAAWLEELYVVPERRGHGIGNQLLEAALKVARERGCAAVDLEVEQSHGRAENLYRRAGFAALARARWVRRLER